MWRINDFKTLPQGHSLVHAHEVLLLDIASFPELPGCVTHGDTLVEAAQNADEAVEAYVASLINRSLPVPEPIAYQKVSGNIPFRTSQSLHRKLKLKAAIAHKSVNELIEEIIEEHIDEVD